jgi:serine/threonine protein kinase
MVQDINNNPETPDKALTFGAGEIAGDEKRKKVGNYVILKTIGEGSFAKVRLGVHLITEMKVIEKFCLTYLYDIIFPRSQLKSLINVKYLNEIIYVLIYVVKHR